MSRPPSAPPFPQSPETWLTHFRHRAELRTGKHLTPEAIGGDLGVSGATVRRWEKGSAAPTDEDIVRFGAVCNLSHHEIAFLRTAFTSFRPPIPPDHDNFIRNTDALFSPQAVPMVLLDELMYVRAWNSYVSVLGPQVDLLLDRDRHPIECYFELLESRPPVACTEDEARKALRSFWQFSAHYSRTREYASLIDQLHTFTQFERLWSELGDTQDVSAIDIRGVASLLQSHQNPMFRIVHSFCSYPPLYSVFEFHPENSAGQRLLHEAIENIEPVLTFSNRDHWSREPCWGSDYGLASFQTPKALGQTN